MVATSAYIRKIFRYDPTLGGVYSKYYGYCLSTEESLDPPMLPGEAPVHEHTPAHVDIIVTSPLLRATESAFVWRSGFLNKPEIMVLAEIAELRIDLAEMLTEEEFQDHGSTLVRKRFVDGFIDDTLPIKRDAIIKRIETAQSILHRFEHVLVISHSFFMKVWQCYQYTNGKVTTKPELLAQYINPDIKTFEFGAGFDIIIK